MLWNYFLITGRLIGQYCFARWRLSSVNIVVCNTASGRAGLRARGRSGVRHCMAGQYSYVQLGRHLVIFMIIVKYCIIIFKKSLNTQKQ